MSARKKAPSYDGLYSSDLPVYTGASLKMISFPLGGIGTGTIGLGGRGELRDWEIFNNPNLGYRPPLTMPFVFARQGKRRVAKVLERRLLPPFHDSHGLPPDQLAGLPRLREARFVGTYPFARMFFEDDDLPVKISLEAFNPMIPGNAEDSAIPAAILTYRLANPTTKPVSGNIAISMANTVGLSCTEGFGKNVNTFRDSGALRGIYMTGRKYPRDHVGYGTQSLVTTARKVRYITDFDEGGWRDRAQKVWDGYCVDGRLNGPAGGARPSKDGETRIGMLAADYNLRPGGSTTITFLIAWSFPTRLTDWIVPAGYEPEPVRNHYARKFPDAWQAARYVAKNLTRLRSATRSFEQAMLDSTLPGSVMDAVSSQMSIIRTNTTMWLDSPSGEDQGRIFAFEGCSEKRGSCPMNCTHVWNYEQSMAHLYPSLERTMRLTDYEDNLDKKGAMAFRTTLPLQEGLPLANPKTPAADGQFGTVVKVYREWRISGDDEWLQRLWPHVRQSIRFAWKGFARWDADRDGVMEGVQHNTYDIEFHGPNTMCGALYLAALLAGAEMAQAVGDEKAAGEFQEVFASGSGKYDKMLFNGRYYFQKIVSSRKAYRALAGPTIRPGHPRYQYGRGCLADQLLGQWAAHVAGLGYVLPKAHVKRAMAQVYRHNFMDDLSAHASCQRTYALNDEAGLVLCTWPDGGRERFPFPYCDEVWTGFEYQVAAHLIYEGLIEEGLMLVKAARDRHNGIVRNPWNEFECGDHYARAMSSWSVLLALSGQRYDGRTEALTIRPAIETPNFKCIYTANDAYGLFSQKVAPGTLAVRIDCRSGQVPLRRLHLALPAGRAGRKLSARVRLGSRAIGARIWAQGEKMQLELAYPVVLHGGDVMTVRTAW